MKAKTLRILVLGALGISLLPADKAEAELIIWVKETAGNVRFEWSGVIGNAVATTNLYTPSADYIDPRNGDAAHAFNVADRDSYPMNDTAAGFWTPLAGYSGTTTPVYGTGSAYSAFTVHGDGLPFGVHPDGRLMVGTAESLSTAVFAGYFEISGTLASRGLFDTAATETPLTLWAATGVADPGSIVFEVIPEPSTLAMLMGLAGIGLLGCMRRRRS